MRVQLLLAAVLVGLASLADPAISPAQPAEPVPYYLQPPPPWGPIDRDVEQRDADACAAPGAPVIGLPGQTLYRGQRNQIDRATVSASGLVALAITDPDEALIFVDGVDKPPLHWPLANTIVVALRASADGRFLFWNPGDLAPDGPGILDLSARRLAPILGLDCDVSEVQWMGHDLALSCRSPKPGMAVLTPDGDSFRQTQFFPDVVMTDEAAVATVDESGTRLVRGAKVYASIAAAVADGGVPDLDAAAPIYRLGDRLLQVTDQAQPPTAGGYPPPNLVLRDADTGKTVKTRAFSDETCRPNAIAVAPDGRSFAMLLGGFVVEVIDAADLSTRAVYSLRRSPLMPATGLAILPDGRLVSWSDMDVAVHDPQRSAPEGGP